MEGFIFKNRSSRKEGDITVSLTLVEFVDDKNIHIIYSPTLDLSGYGNTLKEAKTSFEIAFVDFVDYTLKKHTLTKVLKSLGWEMKGTSKKPTKIKAPNMSLVMKENDYVAEIFDKYPVITHHEQVRLPTYA